MKIVGWILFALGLGALAWSYAYDPSFMPNPAMYWERTVNLGLLAEKVVIGIVGGALSVSGAVIAGTGHLIESTRADAMRALSKRDRPAAE